MSMKVIALTAAFAAIAGSSAQNARILHRMELEVDRVNQVVRHYTELPSTPDGTIGVATWLPGEIGMRVDTLDFFGRHRQAHISFFENGFSHGRFTSLTGLPSGGFAAAGFAENAANRRVPFLAYITPAGTLGWKRLLGEYAPSGYSGVRMIALPAPGDTVTAIFAPTNDNELNFIHRFHISGTPLGFRGSIGRGSAIYNPLSNGFAMLRRRQGLSGDIWSIERFSHDAIRTGHGFIGGFPLLDERFLNVAEHNGGTYFSVHGNPPRMYRMDPEGNLRWETTLPLPNGTVATLKSINGQLLWSAYAFEDGLVPYLYRANSFGTLNLAPPNGLARNFDLAGPVGLVRPVRVSHYASRLWGGDWAGNNRFRVIFPNQEEITFTDLAALPQGRWGVLEYRFVDSVEWMTASMISQAPVTRPNEYRARFETPMSVSPASGVIANDLFAEGLAATLETSTANGALTFRTDGSFDYLPRKGFIGTDTFTYRLDRFGDMATGVGTIKVRAQGDVISFPTTNVQFVPFGRSRNLHVEIERASSAGFLSVSSSSPGLTVPTTVTFPPSATVVTIPATALASSSGGVATVTATSANYSATWSVNLVPEAFSGNIVTDGFILRPGGVAIATIRIDRIASSPVGIAISTDASRLVTVPEIVTIPVGSDSVSFPIRIRQAPNAETAIQLLGRRGVLSVTGVLTIGP